MPICAPGMPGISKVGMPPASATSTSISLAASSPARSILRNLALVSGLAVAPIRASRMRSSVASSARALTSARLRSRFMLRAISTRSRTICSTSRPT